MRHNISLGLGSLGEVCGEKGSAEPLMISTVTAKARIGNQSYGRGKMSEYGGGAKSSAITRPP